MAVAVRYVDKRGQVIERFLGIEQVTCVGALSRKTTVEGLCCRLGLRTDNLRGQGYGLADNVKSKLNGLKTLMLNENPCAHYVPSFAYKLQSTLFELAWNHSEIGMFFLSFNKIGKIVGATCKRQDFLREKQAAKIVEALNVGELASGQGSNPESADTGCGSHYSALVNLIGMFAEVIDDLELIFEEGSRVEDQAGADTMLDAMLTFDFVFCLHLMKTVLGATNELSLALEMKDEGIVNAMELVQVSKGRLHMIRETGWASLLEDVTSLCIKHKIRVPDMDDMFIARGWRKSEFQDMKYLLYYQEIFYAVIDLQIEELIVRFTDSSIEMLLCVACLNPSNSFSIFDKEKLIRLAEFYPKEFSPKELMVLRDQLDTYILDVRSSYGFSRLNTISDLGKLMVETGRDRVYPLVYLLLTLALLLPVATATKAFSGMKFVKERLSIEIGDKWMCDRLILCVEEDIFDGISDDSIVQSLQKMKPRWADCKTLH
ncbi:hypothetical protein RHMOL_Rhmol11G0151400 [Rhododendron molle]|uniref:Uncharacterized protein n=1 Tax=Rhododendron molle TaxID=49168 RepID=A0ACC0LTH8_RHOML|nr:hypothetical protein RHMOL_Rhmol11G0151400 [Rhododendron molle]